MSYAEEVGVWSQGLREYFANVTIPFIETNTCQATVHGNGTLFSIDSELFIITAAHVAENFNDKQRNFGIPIAKKNAEVLCFPTEGTRIEMSHEPDIAIVKVDASTKTQLLNCYSPLSLRDISAINPEHEYFFLSGYPRERAKLIGKSHLTSEGIFGFKTKLYEGNDSHCGSPYICLEYNNNIFTERGERESAPQLPGISGSPVWSYEGVSGGIWSPEKELKLVAVQTAWTKDSYRYIQCVPLCHIIALFNKITPEFGEKINSALQRTC